MTNPPHDPTDPAEIDALIDGEWINPEYPESGTEGELPPPPEDAADADRMLRKALIYRRQAEVAASRFDAVIAELQAKRDEVVRPLVDAAEFHEGQVMRWHIHERQAGRADQTVRLPSGTSELRRLPNRVVVTDEDTLRAWAETNGHTLWVEVPATEKFDKAGLNKIVQAAPGWKGEPGAKTEAMTKDGTGEKVPGVEIEANTETHKVKTTKDGR